MNDKNITKIQNLLTTCLDCAGIEPEQTIAPVIKKSPAGISYYVDLCIEEYNEEQLASFVGFLTEQIGFKNIWFDTYPKSGRVDFELIVPKEVLAR